MNLHNAWTSLRHGGNLLLPAALNGLPAADEEPWWIADRLRAALVALDPDKPAVEALGGLLDVVLEQLCGLRDGWEKGSALGAAEAEKLLDGTAFKPRRRWTGPGGEVLAVFTTRVTRIGLGKGRRPAAQVVEYLRRRGIPLGLLTNGRQWRLIWADNDSLAWAEWEADRWLAADRLSDEAAVLWRVLSPASLTRGDADQSPLLAAIRETRRGQAKLSKELGERVRRAVEALLRSRQPLVGPAWAEHAGAELYVAACHFVMRLVVILFAEARELLPTDNPVYHRAYGLRGLLDQLDRLGPERRRDRHMAWPRLLALFRLLHGGSPHPAITLPAYGGDLFRAGDPEGDGVQRALALLEALPEPPDDELVHRVLLLLTRTTQKVREGAAWRTVAAPVDFTELTSEYIGILYEGLLDYELHRAGDEPVLFLNLGDQPALPLDRLEEMDDKALKALVEKAKIKKKISATEDEDGDDEDAEDSEELDKDDASEEDENDDAADDEPDEVAVGEETDADDARTAARARAVAWGRRAAAVGKLARKPRSKKAEARPEYEAQLAAAAEQLVADVKLPGELYLVRWGGTRKGAGTYYTRPQLTLPTVRRTLQPLIYQAEGETADRVQPPEALLSIKVCDPAMGSGSFIVAALRVLTAAVVESLHVYRRIARTNGSSTVDCELLPDADRSLPAEGFEERLEAMVRRAVVEHCLYGVDIDPLAVELARVALWVETLDRRLPFTFLDHKLRCGDALVGTWLDRFRDYPLLCFDRQSPDWTSNKSQWKLVHHPWRVWHSELKERRKEAIAQQVEILTGQLRMQPAASDQELKAAVGRVRRLYRELRAVPAGRPDERARIWRERIQTDAALAKVRQAFDTWCALWFWPLDRLEAMPSPSELHAPSEAARALVREVRDKRRFFHWELEFPDVFTEEGAGFQAVVGNPPWDIQKPNSKEFFSNHDPLYRAYGKQEALRVQEALFEARAEIEEQWLAYVGGFKDYGNFARHAAEPFGDAKVATHSGGDVSLVRGKQGPVLHRTWRGQRARYRSASDPAHPFQHQGSADLNTYKMFVEVGHALLRSGGQLGLLVPSGFYTDKGTGGLRSLLLHACRWRWLYGFENRNKIFDIDSRFKFCVIIAEKGSHTEAIQAAFMRHVMEDWSEGKGAYSLPSSQVSVFSPADLAVLEFREISDLRMMTRIAARNPFLGDPDSDWQARYYCDEFHTSKDSRHFPPLPTWRARGFNRTGPTQWSCGTGRSAAIPIIEGRMIGPYRFNAKGWVSGKGRGAVWRELPPDETRVEPQYLIGDEDALRHANYGYLPGPRVVFKDITSATNSRSAISTFLARLPCAHSAPFLRVGAGIFGALQIGVILNSFTFDALVRLRMGGLHLTWNFLSVIPVPMRSAISCEIALLAARLALTSHHFSPEWLELRLYLPRKPPTRCWAVTPHERLRLRCMLDAIVALLYGLDRDDFASILKDCDHPKARLAGKAFARQLDPKGFWRVDKREDPELRHTVLSLAAFDDLQAAIAAAGDRDAGIQAFCDQNDGDGWMLPETLCLAELGLTRTVEVGAYDERARTPQTVRGRMGERFLDWQLAQTVEDCWAECERNAKAILEVLPAPPDAEAETDQSLAERSQRSLPGMEN